MKETVRLCLSPILPGLAIALFLLAAPASKALGQSTVWISNPTNFQISYKLLFARSAQNFTIQPGLRNEHNTREYPATFLVDLNVSLRGYPQLKRFRLVPGRQYYFQLSGNQLHLLKQPLHVPTAAPAPVTAKVLVYALGGPQPIYHSSIILYNTVDPYINGREWSFWPQGRGVMSNIGYVAGGRVVNAKPSGAGRPIKTFDLTTRHTPQTAAAIFNDVRNRWARMPYRALDSTCNHFVNDVMNSLGAGRHPIQYQNSWGSNVPLNRVQSAFENNYGVTCGQHGHGHVPGHNHNQIGHEQGRIPVPHQGRRIDPKAEILRRVLRRIGL